MRKDYDFDEDIRELDEDELSESHLEKARILVKVIPFVLMIIILIFVLIISSIRNAKKENSGQELQESIEEYADNHLTEGNFADKDVMTSNVENSKDTAEQEEREEGVKEKDKAEASDEETVEYDKDYSKISYEKDAQLKEMMTYWADNNQKALDDLANLDHYKAMSYSLRGTTDFYYYGDVDASGKPNGVGIAVYADNQYYYGDWQNGQRSGNGTWMHYHMHDKQNSTDLYTYHQYTGSWKNDLPEGEGSEHYDYNMELLEENKGYNTNLIGSYAAGLIHGDFYLTNIYSDGNVKEWHASGKNGSWVYQNENVDSEGRRPVQVEDRDPDNYIWLHPDDNKNIGVSCLVSAQKN